MSASLRSPLRTVRGLGAAKHGAEHFIAQRVSAVALALLAPWFVISIALTMGAGYDAARAWVAQPLNALLLIALIVAAFYHMRLGLQVVIEDYIQKPAAKAALLLLNLFATLGSGLAAAFAVIKISLGG